MECRYGNSEKLRSVQLTERFTTKEVIGMRYLGEFMIRYFIVYANLIECVGLMMSRCMFELT